MSAKPTSKARKARFEVTFAWWFKWLYLPGCTVALFLMLLVDPHTQPNYERIAYWRVRALRVREVK
jgi:hypothetical protein